MGREGNRLYLNQGESGFTEVAAERGVSQPFEGEDCSWLWGASAADVDGDGDLDLHTVQWHTAPAITGSRSRLFVNEGGWFTDGTVSAGLDLSDRAAFVSSFGDVDADGDVDLALAADWGDSGLWLNDGGGVFHEAVQAGVGLDDNGMGSDLADYDGDGDLDWFVSAIYDPMPVCDGAWGCSGNVLYENDGSGRFSDVTDRAGVRDGGWGWGAAFFDHDNDGDLDLGHAAGYPIGGWDFETTAFFDSDGLGGFTDRAVEVGLDRLGQGRAFVPFDADNDGDLDLLITRGDDAPVLYENRGGAARGWLRVKASEPGNPFGVGASIWVQAVEGGPVLRRDIVANNTFAGVRPPEAHLGLGADVGLVYEVRVEWPDGGSTVLSQVPPNSVVLAAR
jgi:hypothetical protein